MNDKHILRTTRFAVLYFVAGVALVCASLSLAMPPKASDEYSADESIAKLRKIGESLQVYRKEKGFKDTNLRFTIADAGLPPNMLYLAEPGHVWSLKGGIADFQISYPRLKFPKGAPHFVNVYPPTGVPYPDGDPRLDFSRVLQSRGDDLIVMADTMFGQTPEFKKLLPRCWAIVLRLNGKVEIVEYRSNSDDLWLR